MSGEDDVFSEDAAVVKHSGSGGLAALIAKTRHTGQLKDITKKDNKGHLQRILSVPEQSAQSAEGSKVTYRSSVSVSPSSRNAKCSSVVVLSQSKSPLLPPHMTSNLSSPSAGISSTGTEDTPTSGDTSPNQSDSKRRESNKPVPKPRLVKQSTRGSDSLTKESTKELQAEDLENENRQCLEEQPLEPEKTEKKSLRSQSDNTDGQASKPIPVPRSTRSKTQSDLETKPETPQSPVPKPRSASKLITVQNDEKVKAVKTLQALLPTEGKQKEEPLGPDGLTRTERSLQQMQKLLNEDTQNSETIDPFPSSDTTAKDTTSNKPKPPRTRTTVSESSPPKNDVSVGARPPSKSVSDDKDSTVGATNKQTNIKVASVAVKTSKPAVESKEKSPSPARENAPPQGIRPSPPRPSPPRKVSSEETNKPSLPARENAPPQGIRPSPPRPSPPRKVSSEETNRPSATQGSPSSGSITTSDTDTRVSQTPKEPAKGSAPPTRPAPPARILKPPQKTIQIKSDLSWIKRKDSIDKYDSSTSLSTSQTMPDLTPSPAPVRKPLPYRSHAIITPTTPSSGLAYAPPTLNSHPKPPSNSKPLAVSGSKYNRNRAGTVLSNNEPVEAAKNKRRRNNSFTRSTSDDSIASKIADEGKSKSKKQSPPKKPPRVRHLKNSSDSRPISMIEASANQRSKSQQFTSSCLVGTMPRDLPEDSASPKRGRKDSQSKPEKKGFLGRFRNKTQYKAETPTLREEPDEETDSSSDDEKGGTISRMPRLRHVTPKSKSTDLDDTESEYHQLFEYVFVVELKDKGKGALDTEITYTFPPAPEQLFSGKDAALLAIPQFCFPDIDQWKPTKSYNSESFSFVLTDMMGGRRFGYCRRLLPSGKGPRLPEVYCIVSPLGCFSLYEKILDEVEKRRAVSSSAVFTFLKAIQANPFPRPGRSVEVRAFGARGAGLETVVLTRPMDSRLEHIDFSLLFSTLSPRKIIQIFSSLLLERRVILCANSLSLLSGCAHALLALLYPFEWQHVFIPVLPNSLIDFVCSPLPYIIGINPSLIKELDSMEMEDALVIDLEKKKFVMKIGDETSILPTKLYQYLEHSLSSSVVSGEYKKGATSTRRADEIVVNTFMTFFAYLYGDYKAYMKPVKNEKEFQRPEFIETFSSKSTKRFLEAFQMSQLFENFIEQRENPAKEETTAQSHFEQQLPVLQPRCRDIEIFSSKSRFDRWKLAKGMKKK